MITDKTLPITYKPVGALEAEADSGSSSGKATIKKVVKSKLEKTFDKRRDRKKPKESKFKLEDIKLGCRPINVIGFPSCLDKFQVILFFCLNNMQEELILCYFTINND